jgi:hypothetical protein
MADSAPTTTAAPASNSPAPLPVLPILLEDWEAGLSLQRATLVNNLRGFFDGIIAPGDLITELRAHYSDLPTGVVIPNMFEADFVEAATRVASEAAAASRPFTARDYTAILAEVIRARASGVVPEPLAPKSEAQALKRSALWDLVSKLPQAVPPTLDFQALITALADDLEVSGAFAAPPFAWRCEGFGAPLVLLLLTLPLPLSLPSPSLPSGALARGHGHCAPHPPAAGDGRRRPHSHL